MLDSITGNTFKVLNTSWSIEPCVACSCMTYYMYFPIRDTYLYLDMYKQYNNAKRYIADSQAGDLNQAGFLSSSIYFYQV